MQKQVEEMDKAELILEVKKLREIIDKFCEGQHFAEDRWMNQKHIKPFFEIAATNKEFNKLYMCEFEPSQREIELDAELEKYYKATETGDNKAAGWNWRRFNAWRVTMGYTQNELNSAKRRATNRLGI